MDLSLARSTLVAKQRTLIGQSHVGSQTTDSHWPSQRRWRNNGLSLAKSTLVATLVSCSQIPLAHILHKTARILAYPELPDRQRPNDDERKSQSKGQADHDAVAGVRPAIDVAIGAADNQTSKTSKTSKSRRAKKARGSVQRNPVQHRARVA